MPTRRAAAVAAAVMAVVAALLAPVPATASGSCPSVAVDGTVLPAPAPGVTWSGCVLTGAKMAGADLTGATLVGTSLAGADLTGATLVGTALAGANLGGASLGDTDLRGADLTDAFANGAFLSGADLTGAVAQRALLANATFSYANLTGADLRATYLVDTNWTGAVLDGTDLRGATVQSAQMKGSLPDGVRSGGLVGTLGSWPEGWLHVGGFLVGPRADLSGADLSGLGLQYARLLGSDLRGSVLAGTDLTSADLSGSDLRGATGLASAVLDGVVWGLTTLCPDGTTAASHAQGGSCLGPLDTAAPVAGIASLPAVVPTSTLTVTWAASDVGGSGVSVVEVRWNRRVSTGGTTTAWTTRTYAPGTTTWTFTPALGQRYCFSARARDTAGHWSGWTTSRCTTTVVDDRRLSASSSWWRSVSSAYVAGTYTATTLAGARLSTTSTVAVRRASLLALTCSTCGSVTVYVGSRTLGTVSLRSSVTRRAVIALPALSAKVSGVVRLVVSRAGMTRVDGLALSDV
jgi:uncharacterized protein YjbI with pentapeptide repeats